MCYQPADQWGRIYHSTFDIVPSDVEGFMDELWEFQSAFHDCFARSEPRAHFFDYMVGQFSSSNASPSSPWPSTSKEVPSVGCNGLSVMCTGMRNRCGGITISSWLRRWGSQRAS